MPYNYLDGKLTPEQVKAAYMEKGYSAVAFADHDVFVNHNDLTDENFVALNGYEMEVDLFTQYARPHHRAKTCHMCLVASSPNITKQMLIN